MRKRSFKRPAPLSFTSGRLPYHHIFTTACGLGGTQAADDLPRGARCFKFKFESRAACEVMMGFCGMHGVTAFHRFSDNTVEFLGGWIREEIKR